MYLNDQGQPVYTPEELGIDWKELGSKLVDWTKSGALQEYGPGVSAPPAPLPQQAAPTFLEKYGVFVLLGGAGLVLWLILRGRKKD